jgi:uncharacterized protein (TIGR02145 family)
MWVKAHPEHGLLYTWGAANIGTATTEATNAFPSKSSDRQGICPEGWVIPSDYDWNRLEEEIAAHPALYSTQETPHTWDAIYEGMPNWRPAEGSLQTWWGRSMKSPTQVSPSTATNGVSKEDGTGFNALVVGGIDIATALNYGKSMYFWSGSAGSALTAWRRTLNSSNSGAARSANNKYYSFSVRCKKI